MLEALPELAFGVLNNDDVETDFIFTPEKIRDFIAELIPEQSGDKLKRTIDAEFLVLNAKPFLDTSPETIKTACITAANDRCMNQLKRIMICLHNYHDTFGHFPSPYTTDADGKRLHSWRTESLPFFGHEELYAKIRRKEPWDSEYNKQFHSQCPAVFQCPEAIARFPEMKQKGLTTYSLIVGENSYSPDKRMRLEQITDGTSNTCAVVERKTPVCWMDPAGDILEEDALKGFDKSDKGIGIFHTRGGKPGTHVAFFDGSVRLIPENLSAESIMRFVLRNDGEEHLME